MVGATAVEIARMVQRGDATATGVVADHLDHARVADRILDCLRVLRDGEALAEAELVDDQPDLTNLPLAGVPVLVAEDTAVAGLPTWRGSAAARTRVEPADDEVVRRLRGAGAVVVGVARTSELGLWPSTDDASAITHNPWRSNRSPGGPCGGSAAAVAAGVVPIALGSDELGGARVTAAGCGLVGVKPGSTDAGVLATTVADAALGYAVLTGRSLDELTEPGRLRVAVSLRGPVPGLVGDPDARTAVVAAARLLIDAGHNAVRADPTYPPRLAPMAAAAWAALAHRGAERAHDAAHLQARTRRQVALGAWAQRRGLVREGQRADWRERCQGWFERHRADLLVLPTLAGSPPLAAAWSARSWPANLLTGVRQFAYTAAWNLAGLPAVTVPMGVRRNGVPASVQLVGPPGTERRLLSVAAQLERSAPWRRQAPGWPRPVPDNGSIALARAYATMWA